MENTSFTYKVCKVVFGWWDEMELEYSVWTYGNDNGKAINSYEINYLVLWAKKIIELRTNNYAKALFP